MFGMKEPGITGTMKSPEFKMPSLFKGEGDHIVNSNIGLLKQAGYSHGQAVRTALAHRTKFGRAVKMMPLRVNPIKKLRLKAPGVLPAPTEV